jgi:hypothetical protein
MSTRRRKRHSPEQIIAKLRDGDAMLNAGKDLALVLQALEISESTYERWRATRIVHSLKVAVSIYAIKSGLISGSTA